MPSVTEFRHNMPRYLSDLQDGKVERVILYRHNRVVGVVVSLDDSNAIAMLRCASADLARTLIAHGYDPAKFAQAESLLKLDTPAVQCETCQDRGGGCSAPDCDDWIGQYQTDDKEAPMRIL